MNSFYTTLTGLNAFHAQIAQISNNIANMETTAFKSNDISFEEVLSTTMTLNSPTSAVAGKGVSVTGSTTSWEQGDLMGTSNTTDLAISGEGFFIVTDTSTGTPATYYTRDGGFDFIEDSSTHLATLRNGYNMAVQGLDLDTTNSGNIAIDTSTYIGISIDKNGVISATDTTTGDIVNLYQIELARFPSKDGLDKVDDNLYMATGNSGTAQRDVAGSGQNGSITSGALEMSNVDMASELADLVIAQRAYGACAKVMTAESELLQTTTNMI